MVCLVHAVPRIDSGIGNQWNLRTMVGISRLDKEDYHLKMSHLSLSEMLEMNCWQIAGMCRNNMRSRRLIRSGVRLTVAGVLLFVVALSVIAKREVDRRNEQAAKQASTPQAITPSTESVKKAPVDTNSTAQQHC